MLYEVLTLLSEPSSHIAIAPLLLGGLVSAGGSVLSGLLGSHSQSQTNKTNLELAKYQNSWNEMMYERNLQDQIKLWNMQNEYNSPSEQMSRFLEAGLNPNLIYGQGSPGNASGLNAPSAPRSADMQVQPVDSPLIGFSHAASLANQYIQAYYQNKSLEADIALKDAETLNKLAGVSGVRANSRLAEVNADIQEKTRMDIMAGVRARTESAEAKAKYDKYMSTDDMLAIQGELKHLDVHLTQRRIENLEYATRRLAQTKDYEAWEQDVIRETGIRPGSPNWYSVIVTLLKNFGATNLLKKYMFDPK